MKINRVVEEEIKSIFSCLRLLWTRKFFDTISNFHMDRKVVLYIHFIFVLNTHIHPSILMERRGSVICCESVCFCPFFFTQENFNSKRSTLYTFNSFFSLQACVFTVCYTSHKFTRCWLWVFFSCDVFHRSQLTCSNRLPSPPPSQLLDASFTPHTHTQMNTPQKRICPVSHNNSLATNLKLMYGIIIWLLF